MAECRHDLTVDICLPPRRSGQKQKSYNIVIHISDTNDMEDEQPTIGVDICIPDKDLALTHGEVGTYSGDVGTYSGDVGA